MTTQVARLGNSLALRLPKSVAMEANVSEGDTVEVTVKDGATVISRAPCRYTLEELLEGVTDEIRHGEEDWGAPFGHEAW